VFVVDLDVGYVGCDIYRYAYANAVTVERWQLSMSPAGAARQKRCVDLANE